MSSIMPEMERKVYFIFEQFLTRRCRERCAIKPRRAPELERWLHNLFLTYPIMWITIAIKSHIMEAQYENYSDDP